MTTTPFTAPAGRRARRARVTLALLLLLVPLAPSAKPTPPEGGVATLTVQGTCQASVRIDRGPAGSAEDNVTVSYSETRTFEVVAWGDHYVSLNPVGGRVTLAAAGGGQDPYAEALGKEFAKGLAKAGAGAPSPVSASWSYRAEPISAATSTVSIDPAAHTGQFTLGGPICGGSHVRSVDASGKGESGPALGAVFLEGALMELGMHRQSPGMEVSGPPPEQVNRFSVQGKGGNLSGKGGGSYSFSLKGKDGTSTGTYRLSYQFSMSATGERPKLKAVPSVVKSVQRGEPLTLDGSASTGSIEDYRWTFSGGSGAPDGARPNLQAELHGPVVQVTLLDGMQVTLTVTDGDKTDSRTAAVAVVPRPSFETKVSHVEEEGRLDAPSPRYGRSWTGGENVCAFDPPTSLDEPVHILHPQHDGYTVAQVSDQGPYDGFSYVEKWSVEARRQTQLNKWIVQGAPPMFSYIESFYDANVRMGTDVVAYLGAARRHERMHTTFMERSIKASDPAKLAERSFGQSADWLRQRVDAELQRAEKAASAASKDPLPRIWSGKLAVYDAGTDRWIIIATDV